MERPAPLHINNDSSSVNLSPVSSLVGIRHVFLSLELNEGISARLAVVVEDHLNILDRSELLELSSQFLFSGFISQTSNEECVVSIAERETNQRQVERDRERMREGAYSVAL
jgi:hypothetical protein